MRSRFFADVGLPSQFKEDIKVLADLDDMQMPGVGELVFDVMLERTRPAELEILVKSDLADALGPEKVRACRRAIEFVLSGIRKYRDPVATIVADIVKVGVVAAENETRLINYLQELYNAYTRKVKPSLNERAAVSSTLPQWKSISTAVDLRAIIQDSYKMADPVDTYSPACKGFSPVIIVSLSVEDFEDQVQSLTFQATEESFRRLLSCLIAAQKDLEVATTRFRAGEMEERPNASENATAR